MGNDPGSISTMKRYYSDRGAPIDEEGMMAEMMEANDRSAIITVAAFADSALEFLLASNLPSLRTATEKEYSDAFRHDGPLGTFSARVDLAFHMGLIDQSLRGQLDDLRQIRNAVAHTRRRVTFADHALQNAAKRLFSPTGVFKLLDATPEGYRRTLIAEGNFIYNALVFGRVESIAMMRAAFEEGGGTSPI